MDSFRFGLILWALLFPYFMVNFADAAVPAEGSDKACAQYCVEIRNGGKLFAYHIGEKIESARPIPRTKNVQQILFVNQILFARQKNGTVWGHFMIQGRANWLKIAYGASGLYTDGYSLAITRKNIETDMLAVDYVTRINPEQIEVTIPTPEEIAGIPQSILRAAHTLGEKIGLKLRDPVYSLKAGVRPLYRDVTRIEVRADGLYAIIKDKAFPIQNPDSFLLSFRAPDGQ